MNERIKELIEESRDLVLTQTKVSDGMYIPGPIVRGDVNLQRFAELIVRECIDQISVNHDPTSDWDWEVSRGNAIAIIKEHFGVEE